MSCLSWRRGVHLPRDLIEVQPESAKARSESDLMDTSERDVPDVDAADELEHLHHYLQAARIAAGKIVLDVVLEQHHYGSAILAQKARHVVCVDMSDEPATDARRLEVNTNLEQVAGTWAEIPLPDASVDLLLSFDNIEHFDQLEQLLREVRRVLRPSGTIIICPLRRYQYSIEPGARRSFHVRESDQHRFKQLLESHFSHVVDLHEPDSFGPGILGNGGTGSRLVLASDDPLSGVPGILERSLDESEAVELLGRAVAERDVQVARLCRALAERDAQLREARIAASLSEKRGPQAQAVLNSLLRAASFSPQSLQFPDAWIGHLPFAGWLVRTVSPATLVELGTHSGNSYFSFCQAVVEAAIPTRCFAVDTWQGDEHTGYYGEEVFTAVDAYHQEHYAGFSRLLRMLFDDAVACFSDESIDFLHIDGLHTYEAVRHDFETWLPKLAPGAVVVFHDTNVRERSFGVWKLWAELQLRYRRTLEFVHSHGLGVLQLNNAPASRRLDWLERGFPERQTLISYFSALGARQLERYGTVDLKRRAASRNPAVAEREAEVVDLRQALAEHDRQVASLGQAVAERDRQITSLNQTVAERDRQIAEAYDNGWGRITALLRRLRR
ncbi:MAG: hypothetical protein DMF89_05190 [Acidobacteria bacterium]|nr:MAG: hypothetical protein DMF89_05190 [Acidobacteriota bacterium]